MADRQRRVAIVLKRASLIGAVQSRIQALYDEGCAVHLALQGLDLPPGQETLAALWADASSISVGYAIPRRDRWKPISERLAQPPPRAAGPEDEDLPEPPARSAAQLHMRAALPADPGVLAYLRQLDLDLAILTDLGAQEISQFDYLLACRQLNIPTELIELPGESPAESGDAEAPIVAIPAERPRDPYVEPARSLFWRAALWATLLGDQLGPPLLRVLGFSDKGGVRRSPLDRLQDTYVERVFPWLVSGLLRMLPGTHPVLIEMSRQLSPAKLHEMMSIETAMADACRGSGPIIFGPWTADIDTELVFWIPFLRWYRRRYQIDRDRIVVVSRDDTRSWYEGVGGRYIDVNELYSVEDVDALGEQRTEELTKRNKQFAFTRADQVICRKVAKRLSAARLNTLHPRTMHVLFERYMSEVSGHAYVASYTRYQQLSIKPAKVRQLCPGLPDRYVAVSFEFNGSFPDTKANRAFAVRTIRQIAEKTDIVLVGSKAALKLGEQVKSPRIHPIEHDPRRVLGVHSAVIAGAQAFVGTYYGLAYVAANLGRPVIGFESEAVPGQLPHRNIAAREFGAYGGSVTLLRTSEVENLGWLLACSLGEDGQAPKPALAVQS